MKDGYSIDRRGFLRGTAAGAGLAYGPRALARGRSITLVLDKSDPAAAAPPVRIAAQELEKALDAAGFAVHRRLQPQAGESNIIAAGPHNAQAAILLAKSGLAAPAAAEGLALVATDQGVLACGADARGLAYALHELADRVRHTPKTALSFPDAVIEGPANPVRSLMR